MRLPTEIWNLCGLMYLRITPYLLIITLNRLKMQKMKGKIFKVFQKKTLMPLARC